MSLNPFFIRESLSQFFDLRTINLLKIVSIPSSSGNLCHLLPSTLSYRIIRVSIPSSSGNLCHPTVSTVRIALGMVFQSLLHQGIFVTLPRPRPGAEERGTFQSLLHQGIFVTH